MSTPSPETRAGFLAALSAYLAWGVMPLYLRLLMTLPVFELLAWRILFTVPAALLGVLVLRETKKAIEALAKARVWGALAISSALIGVNWGVYVWAVFNDHILQASLGYFLNPLVNVALGVLVLKERLTRLQGAAVALAAAGVTVQAAGLGELPWVTLTLGISFGLYGLVRKLAPVPAAAGLLAESAILSPASIIGLAVMASAGNGLALAGAELPLQLMVAGAGVVTAIPLILFAFGARRLTLATVGLLQYIAPSIQFAIGILQGEPFTAVHAVSFGLIWGGLALFSFEALRSAGFVRLQRG